MSQVQPPRGSISQVCAIPFRRSGGELEFCLITSLKKKRWIYPKGIIDPGETLEQTAVKESLEEAGLHGRLVGRPLGSYEDAKWGTTLRVKVVLLEVDRCEQTWPESDVRQRRWVPAKDAAELISKRILRDFTAVAIERLHGPPKIV